MGRLSVSHRKRRLWGDQAGQAAVSNLVAVLVVAAAVLTSWVLLYRTTATANRINTKAAHIAKVGQGINIATDSVIQLNRTNATASSILTTAKPLEGKLNEIIGLGKSINGLAASIDGTAKTINGTGATVNGTATKINGTAKTINGTAGDIQGTAVAIDSTALKINGTAKGINSTAAAILDVAHRINDDVATINLRIDNALGIVGAVKGDTGNILGQAQTADRLAKCIDSRIGNPGAC